MSVSAFISNNDDDATMIPIATEKRFQDDWMPIINQLDLKWIACFQSGIEIGREDLDFVLQDLDDMCNWIDTNMNNPTGDFIRKRIKNLSGELVRIFTENRYDIKVYIG